MPDYSGHVSPMVRVKNANGSNADGGSVQRRLKVFASYAHKDEVLWKELDEHLGALKHEKIIEVWWDVKIIPGANWNEDIIRELEAADLILLLISPAFLNSAYCYHEEMRRAIDRHEAGIARVVPIALRSCDWEPTLFAKLKIQGLPKGMQPVASSPKNKRDAIWAEVAKGIRQAAQACAASRLLSGP